MSQAEWSDVAARIVAQEQLYIAQVEKSRLLDEEDDLAQIKFILSLRSVRPACKIWSPFS